MREARAPFVVSSVDAAVSVVSVLCDQVNQVVPAHQVDDIDEAHQVDPVHQVDHQDEHTGDFGRLEDHFGGSLMSHCGNIFGST